MSVKLMSPRFSNLSTKAALAGALVLSLSACSSDSLKDSLGYGKTAPDEFAIVTKAPLAMPPDFSLRPPAPGTARPQEAMFEPNLVAERALTGDEKVESVPTTGSVGEQALLEKTGGAEANPKIRQVVDNENRSLVAKDETFTDEVLFWQTKAPTDAREVDANGERRRIEQNEAQGKPVTEGDTPVVEPEKQGFFSGLWSSIF